MILDARTPSDRLSQIGRMCELAGLDAVWIEAEAAASVWPVLAAIAEKTQRIALGVMLPDAPPPEATGRFGSRLEVTLPLALGDNPGRPRDWKLGLRLDGRDPTQCDLAVRLADDAVLSAAVLGGAAQAAVAAATLRDACAAQGRDPDELGIALELPVSIGRTAAEALARAAAEPRFAESRIGAPSEVGLFGTLEECQRGTIALAHAGVTDLRCWLPNAPDLPDVIAQLTAMVVGSLDVLSPAAPRSRDPDPPAAWGGRPRFPRPRQP